MTSAVWLSRMRELATQAATDTLNDSDRASINLEFQTLKNEVSRVAHAAEYNEMNLLNGTAYKNEVHRANTTADDVRGISIQNAKLSNDIRKGIYTLSDQHVDVSNQADISNLSGTAITDIRYSVSSLQPALGETHSINSQVNPAEVDIINGVLLLRMLITFPHANRRLLIACQGQFRRCRYQWRVQH